MMSSNQEVNLSSFTSVCKAPLRTLRSYSTNMDRPSSLALERSFLDLGLSSFAPKPSSLAPGPRSMVPWPNFLAPEPIVIAPRPSPLAPAPTYSVRSRAPLTNALTYAVNGN